MNESIGNIYCIEKYISVLNAIFPIVKNICTDKKVKRMLSNHYWPAFGYRCNRSCVNVSSHSCFQLGHWPRSSKRWIETDLTPLSFESSDGRALCPRTVKLEFDPWPWYLITSSSYLSANWNSNCNGESLTKEFPLHRLTDFFLARI